jgi:hypothetical protein
VLVLVVCIALQSAAGLQVTTDGKPKVCLVAASRVRLHVHVNSQQGDVGAALYRSCQHARSCSGVRASTHLHPGCTKLHQDWT